MNIWITLFIVTLTYIGIALGEFPRLRANRTTITLMAVGVLLVLKQITFEQISGFLNLDTLVLLMGMMIINANLQLSGFFRLAGSAILRFTNGPRSLLALEIVVVGVLSALFLNDTICLVLTPLILDITLNAKRNPIPYLIALATASNIGSVATLTGNPQNIIIGVASHISYLSFVSALAPIAVLGLGGVWLVIVLFYKEEFKPGPFETVHIRQVHFFKPLLYKTILVIGGLLIAFMLGAPIAEAAFIAACVLLFTRRVHPKKILNAIDTDLLFFFGALFVVSGTIESSGLSTHIFEFLRPWLNAGVVKFSIITIILSNLVSNVPAVLLLKPLIPNLSNPHAAWLTLAAVSTMAGNLTLLGSVANLIVAEAASRHGIKLSFWEFTKPGIIITLISLALGIGWISMFIWK